MSDKTAIVPKKSPDLLDPDHIRFEPQMRRRLLEVAEETGQGLAACVRHLVGAGLEAYDKSQGRK